MGQKVLLSSGGMDSALLASEPELAGAIHVFIDIGQKYGTKELVAAKRVAARVAAQFIYIPATKIADFEHSSGIIPFRNAEMLLCAAQYGTDLYFGVIADEINSDKSPEFCAAMEQVLNISHRKQYWSEGKQFRIRTPFREMSKTTLVKRYFERGGDLATLLESVSCYDSSDMHCGQCASCFKRWVALTNALGESRYRDWGFMSDPYTWKSQSHWANTLPYYSEQRAAELVSAFAIARNSPA